MSSHPYSAPLLAVLVLAAVLLAAVSVTDAVASEAGDSGAYGETVVYQDAGDDDDDPQIGRLAFLTIAAAGAAALLGLIGYAVRRAVGYEPHRPGPEDEHAHH